jgi:hypothetical protein
MWFLFANTPPEREHVPQLQTQNKLAVHDKNHSIKPPQRSRKGRALTELDRAPPMRVNPVIETVPQLKTCDVYENPSLRLSRTGLHCGCRRFAQCSQIQYV